jgi:TetR/AcrR family transcriptional regulator
MPDVQHSHPMDVPSSADRPKRRKEEILDVATSLFAERGYDGASMNDVAERVGMRKASLFYHFATKDALYEAVLDRLVERLAAPLSAIYGAAGSFVERLDTAADALASAIGDSRFAARLLIREAMDWGPVIRGKLLDKLLLTLEESTAFVRAGQEAGVFVEGDARHLVLTAVGAHFLPFALGQVVERYMGSDPFDPSFVLTRRQELRMQVRNMFVRSGP